MDIDPGIRIITSTNTGSPVTASITPVLIVHGGAGDITDDRVQGKYDGMIAAIRKGYTSLLADDNPLNAVEQAVKIMENLADFNAGYGSVLTKTGEVEMDALIINGTDLKAGAVGAIRHVTNPISVARLVMEKTEHVFLVGQEAENFAESEGVPIVPTSCMIAKKITKETDSWPGQQSSRTKSSDFDVGTVGAVAINSKGQIAAATSTGGMSGKLNGRVGDSPIIGGGTLADDLLGGVSATGYGEAFMRVRIASLVTNYMAQGKTPSEAGTRALADMVSRIPGADGGVIVISKEGAVGYSFNSNRMAWAYANDDQLIHHGINPGDDLTIAFGAPGEPILPPDCSPEGSSSTTEADNDNGGGAYTAPGFFLTLMLMATHLFCLF